MEKGEVWIVELPSVNGHEQAGTRPAIVIADTEVDMVIAAPFTSNSLARRFPHTIEIKPSKRNGLYAKSIALLFQIRSIDHKRLKSKVGTLEPTIITQADNILKKMLKLT